MASPAKPVPSLPSLAKPRNGVPGTADEAPAVTERSPESATRAPLGAATRRRNHPYERQGDTRDAGASGPRPDQIEPMPGRRSWGARPDR